MNTDAVDQLPIERVKFGMIINDFAIESIRHEAEICGWTLSKASGEEVDVCSETIRKFTSLTYLELPHHQYLIEQDETAHKYAALRHSEDWRYAVVRPSENATLCARRLAEALRVSEADIFVELWRITDDKSIRGMRIGGRHAQDGAPAHGVFGSPSHVVQFFSENPPEPPTRFDIENVKEVVELRAKLDDKVYPAIARAMQMYRELDVNPPGSMKMLGYFAVLESLLSHCPNPSDTVDSITRQLKRNLILLNNRMTVPYRLGLDEFDAKPGTIISKMYSYRSAIAHGGNADKELRSLHNLRRSKHSESICQWMHVFMRRLVRRVLVQSLREPQLVMDLKG